MPQRTLDHLNKQTAQQPQAAAKKTRTTIAHQEAGYYAYHFLSKATAEESASVYYQAARRSVRNIVSTLEDNGIQLTAEQKSLDDPLQLLESFRQSCAREHIDYSEFIEAVDGNPDQTDWTAEWLYNRQFSLVARPDVNTCQHPRNISAHIKGMVIQNGWTPIATVHFGFSSFEVYLRSDDPTLARRSRVKQKPGSKPSAPAPVVFAPIAKDAQILAGINYAGGDRKWNIVANDKIVGTLLKINTKFTVNRAGHATVLPAKVAQVAKRQAARLFV